MEKLINIMQIGSTILFVGTILFFIRKNN